MIEFKNKYKFENLEVWILGKELYKFTSAIFYKSTFRNYSFQDQIMRAVISVTNNIAEGYERCSNKELMHFLYISKGSCGEVRSMLHLALESKYIDEKDFETLGKLCVKISVKLNNLIKAVAKKQH